MANTNMADTKTSLIDGTPKEIFRESTEEDPCLVGSVDRPDVLKGSVFYCNVRQTYILPPLTGQPTQQKTPLSSPIQESFAAQTRFEKFSYQQPPKKPRLLEEGREVAERKLKSKYHNHLNRESSEGSRAVDSEMLLPLLRPIAIEDELPSTSDRSRPRDLSTACQVDSELTKQRDHNITSKRSVSRSPSKSLHDTTPDEDAEREEGSVQINREPPAPPRIYDYQMQLMLLEQQNKKRMMVARAEQDSIIRCRMMVEEQARKGSAENPLYTCQSGLPSPPAQDKTIPNAPSMATSIGFGALRQAQIQHVLLDHAYRKRQMQLPLKRNEDTDYLVTNSAFSQMDPDIQVEVRRRLAKDKLMREGTTGDKSVDNEVAQDDYISLNPQRLSFLDEVSDMERQRGPQGGKDSTPLDQEVSFNKSKEAQAQLLRRLSPPPLRSLEASKNTTRCTDHPPAESQEIKDMGVDYGGVQDNFERERVLMDHRLHSYPKQPILLEQKNTKPLAKDGPIQSRKSRENKEHANKLSPTFTLYQHCDTQEQQRTAPTSGCIQIDYQEQKTHVQEEERWEKIEDQDVRREERYEQQQGCEAKTVHSVPTHIQPILDMEKRQARQRALERMRRMSISFPLPHKNQELSAALSLKNIEQSQDAEENASLDSDDTMEYLDDVMDNAEVVQQPRLPELYAPNLDCMDIWIQSVGRESIKERLEARPRTQVVDSAVNINKSNEKLVSPKSLTTHPVFHFTQVGPKVTITTITTVTTVTTTTDPTNGAITETTVRSDTTTAVSEAPNKTLVVHGKCNDKRTSFAIV